MADKFQGYSASMLTPSENAYPVVPDDVQPLAFVPKYLYIGTAGNVALRTTDSAADVLFKNVPAGAYLFVRASHVRANGTTASSIIACA